jgi:hypothetical protein
MGLQPIARMPCYIVQPKATSVNHKTTTNVTKLGGYVHNFLLFSNSVREPANNNWCDPLTYKNFDAHDLALKDGLSNLLRNVLSV